MKIRKVLLLLCISLLVIGIPIRTNSEESNGKRIILIDPGHGGIDGGAKSKNGTIEKNINLQISEKLKKQLEDLGYVTYMTRTEDLELNSRKAKDLGARCQMKRDTKCDLFISIHQNMFPQANCFGAQVWYASNDNSKRLAENIQTSLKEIIDDKNKRVAKPAKEQYKILRDNYEGASVIVECGFLSNYDEEQKLKTDEHQIKIARGITIGVNKYFDDKKS